MSTSHTSPFAVGQPGDAEVLLQFLEQQSEVLGAVDRPLVLEALAGRRRLKLVDFGCGEGSYLASLIRGAPTGLFAEVLGLDVNPGWLPIARQRSYAVAATFQKKDICAPMETTHADADVVFSRFTLISTKNPDQAIHNAWQMLNPGGLMVAIESSYSLALAMNTSPVMDSVCERLIAWYQRAGSRADEGLELWRRFSQAGFTLRRDLTIPYGNHVLGNECFAAFTAMAATNLGAVYPDIFPEPFCSELPARLLHDFSAGLLGCMATNLVIAEKS